MAIIRPALGLLDRLEPPLNGGERRVADELARQLDDEWTVYVQPRLGQDTPDFVAVHDDFGVCAIEVKDWAYGPYRQADDGTLQYATGDGVWHTTRELPRYQAYRYRSTIYEHFFALPDDGSKPTHAVRSVLLLANYSTAHERRLFATAQVTPHESQVEVFGGDDIGASMSSIVRAKTCKVPRAASMKQRPRNRRLPVHLRALGRADHRDARRLTLVREPERRR